MDVYHFNSQSIKERAALIWEHGNSIEFRDEDDCRIVLYDMGKFYAEIWFDADMQVVKRIRGFKSLQLLEPYLAGININVS